MPEVSMSVLGIVLSVIGLVIPSIALGLKLGELREKKIRAADPQLKIRSRERHSDRAMTVLGLRNTGALVYDPAVRPGPEVSVELSRAIKRGGILSRIESGGDARLTVTNFPTEGEAHPPVKFYFGFKFRNARGKWRQHDYFVNNEDLYLRAAGRGKRDGWRALASKRVRSEGQYPWPAE